MTQRRLFCEYDRDFNTLGFAIMINSRLNRIEDIKRYLKQGAGKGFETTDGESLLCFAFKHYSSNYLIQLLVDDGCLESSCGLHDHALFCALNCPSLPSFDKDFLQLLIKKHTDYMSTAGNSLLFTVKTPLCFALKRGVPAGVIQMLLEGGCSLRCAYHSRPLRCATSGVNVVRREWDDDFPDLKADVVKMLLHTGVDIQVLTDALVHCKYETEAIELLLDSLKDEDLKAFKEKKSHNSLLHLAVSNPYVRLDVVKLLIKQVGIKVEKVNKNKDTILHEVMKERMLEDHEMQLCGVVKFLLESGAQVNVLNSSGQTPLHVGVHRLHGDDVKHLLDTEAPIFGISLYFLLEDDVYDSEFCPPCTFFELLEKGLECCKMLLKHYFLEISDSVFQSWMQGEGDKEPFVQRGKDWIRELQKLDTKIAGQERTLREYLGGRPAFQTAKSKMKAETVAFNQLLRTMTENAFPLFNDVIATLLPRPAMEIKLKELQGSEGAEDKLLLNHTIVSKKGEPLTKQDLLRSILAFSKHNDLSCDGKVSKGGLIKGNRSGMESKLGNNGPFYKSNDQASGGQNSKVGVLKKHKIRMNSKPETLVPIYKFNEYSSDEENLKVTKLLEDIRSIIGSVPEGLVEFLKTNARERAGENSKVEPYGDNGTGEESNPSTSVPVFKANVEACALENSKSS